MCCLPTCVKGSSVPTNAVSLLPGFLARSESAVFGGMRGYSVWWPSVPSTLDCNDVLCAAPVCQVGIGAGLGVAVPFRTPGISILAGYMR